MKLYCTSSSSLFEVMGPNSGWVEIGVYSTSVQAVLEPTVSYSHLVSAWFCYKLHLLRETNM